MAPNFALKASKPAFRAQVHAAAPAGLLPSVGSALLYFAVRPFGNCKGDFQDLPRSVRARWVARLIYTDAQYLSEPCRPSSGAEDLIRG
jgi:hypothetical protein